MKTLPNSDSSQDALQVNLNEQTAAKIRFLASVVNMSPSAYAEAVLISIIEYLYDLCNPTRPPRN